MPSPQERPPGEHFEEAIARWHLHVQTEVKRSSSLPTAMFDACDPNLEARLADATERIFGLLLDHRVPPAVAMLPEEQLHLELVEERELRGLVQRLRADHGTPPPTLDDGLRDEYLSVLADLCCNGEPTTRRDAARRLRRDFALADVDDLEHLTGALTNALRRCTTTASADEAERIERLCHDIARATTAALADVAATDPA
ncbi:MAG: hypothetical protein IPK26_21630 [Planctomycetes bacterium]|nr:hypothetical protein [Planctomycetota bacterium]